MAGNVAKRTKGGWRARYRDDTGKEHSRHFDRKVDAQPWLDQVTAAVMTCNYADPRPAGSPSRPSSESGRAGRYGRPEPCLRCRSQPGQCRLVASR